MTMTRTLIALALLLALAASTCSAQDRVFRDVYVLRLINADSIPEPTWTPAAGECFIFYRGKAIGWQVKHHDGTVTTIGTGTGGGGGPESDPPDSMKYWGGDSAWHALVPAALNDTGAYTYNAGGDTLRTGANRYNIEGATVTIADSTINWSVPQHTFFKSISANQRFVFSNVLDGKWIWVGVTNTGSYTVTWVSDVTWPDGDVAPTQTASKTDWYVFWRVNSITWGARLDNY